MDKVEENDHYGDTVISTNENIKIINCNKCNYFHQYPLPDENERKRYYQDKYFQEIKADYFEKEKKDLKYNVSRYSEKEEILRKNLNSETLSILDIGAGSGFFLNYFYEKGWEAYGVEPNKVICELAEKEFNIDMFCGTINDFMHVNDRKFSAVHLSYVLEHLVNPSELLNELHRNILSSRGLICVEVPNDFNPLQEIVYSKIQKPWWIAKDHINYFNLTSLKGLLIKCGFDIIESSVTFPMEFFILMGDDYVSNPDIGNESHIRRVKFELNLKNYNKSLKSKLYESFKDLGIGRSIIIYGRKNI